MLWFALFSPLINCSNISIISGFRASPQVGSEVPVHATAVGKIHLAFSEEIFLSEAAEDREAFTQSTLVQPHELERDIEQIRESGVAWNREEWIPGLFVVAAPIQVSGRMLGSVAIALPSSRRYELGEALLEAEVRIAAKRISERLSGQRIDSLRQERRADG